MHLLYITFLWLFLHPKKYPSHFWSGYFGVKSWQCPTLTWGDPTLPSALTRFTSEFGMGSGGATSLLPPGKAVRLFVTIQCVHMDNHAELNLNSSYWFHIHQHCFHNVIFCISRRLIMCYPPSLKLRLVPSTEGQVTWGYMVKPHGQLVPVSFIHYCTSTPGLSTL